MISELVLARFLLSLVDRGPTAPAGFFAGIVWLNKYIGFKFPTQSPSLEDFRRPETSHQAVQATSLEPWEYFNLHDLARKGSQHQLVYTLLLFVSVACLRFEHLSISTNHSACPNFLRGHTPKANAWYEATGPVIIGACRGAGLIRNIRLEHGLIPSWVVPLERPLICTHAAVPPPSWVAL